ncbi:sensor domain-containing protein [Marinomonas epiphytica]
MPSITGYKVFDLVKRVAPALLLACVCFYYLQSNLNIWLSFLISLALYSSFLLVLVHRYFSKHLTIFKSLLDSHSDVVLVKDHQAKFTYANHTLLSIYETSLPKLIGRYDYELTGDDKTSNYFHQSALQVLSHMQKVEDQETAYDVKSQKERQYSSIKLPFYDVNGNKKLMIFAKDVSELVRLKEEASKDRNRLAHVLDVSQEGLWEWNVNTNEVLHNHWWEKISGVAKSDQTFIEFENCIYPEDREYVQKAIGDLVGKNIPYNIEFRITRPDGKLVWLWDRGRIAEYDIEGNPLWVVGIVQDITELKQNKKAIEKLAYYDQLTGLYNRTHFEKHLKTQFEVEWGASCFSAILFLDLDRFKLLNDSYGHHVGDQLIKKVAQRLNTSVHKNDTLARFGGDEFVIYNPCVDSNEESALHKTRHFAEKLIDEICKTYILSNDSVDHSHIQYDISMSVGGIVFQHQQVSTSYLLQLADIAMYRSKMKGGHQSQIFGLNEQNDLTRSGQIIKDLKKSVSQQDFCVFFQPKVNKYGQVLGAEALVRWQHPERGLLFPGDFISEAEESNLIVDIGYQVLHASCQKLKTLQASPTTKDIQVSINLSAKQLWQSGFAETFLDIVNRYGIDPSKLVVEVTESVLIHDLTDATQKLAQLKEKGVKVSLDDFGTGYSSLSYLHRFPIDELKIDKSFVMDSYENAQAKIMVKSIIDLANNFSIKVVAEGVENKVQLDFLDGLGVSTFQGYFFSKPLPEVSFDQFILSKNDNN